MVTKICVICGTEEQATSDGFCVDSLNEELSDDS